MRVRKYVIGNLQHSRATAASEGVIGNITESLDSALQKRPQEGGATRRPWHWAGQSAAGTGDMYSCQPVRWAEAGGR